MDKIINYVMIVLQVLNNLNSYMDYNVNHKDV